MDGWMDGWTDGWMEERTDGRTDGRMGVWLDVKTIESGYKQKYSTEEGRNQ